MSYETAARLAISLATQFVANDSASLCLGDAIDLAAAGRHAPAADRAIKSIAHSVGIFHAAYSMAANARQDAQRAAGLLTA